MPVSVSAMTGEDFASRHLAHLSDLTAQIPNVEISASRGSTLTDVVIRGIGVANDFSINQASPVGIYLDDSYMASRVFAGAQAFDLDRVEVLRGPQGTLFGRNTTGGLINFITRKPGLGADNGRIEAGYGNFNDVRVQGAWEHTLVPDVLGVRAAVVYHRHDGYYHNILPGQPDAEDLDTVAGRVEVRWKPNPNLDVGLKVYGQRDDNHQWNVRVKLVGAAREIPEHRYDVNQTVGSTETSSWGGQLKVVADLSDEWTLTSATSFDHGDLEFDDVHYDGRGAGPGEPGYTAQSQDATFRQVNEELRLNYEGTAVKAVVGAYYGNDIVRDSERYDLVTVVPVSPIFRYEQERVSKAIFGQVDYSLLESLTLTAGLRYTHDTNTYRHGHADVAIPVVPGGLINTLPGAFSPTCPGLTCPDAELPPQRGTSNGLTTRLAAKYAFSPYSMAYASYTRGYRSGAYNGIAYLSPAQVEFVRPEKVSAFELGAKTRLLGGRAQISGALFYNDYKDQQVNFLRSVVTALGPFPVNILDNVPKAETYGAEIEATVLVTDNVRVHLTGGLLDTKYDSATLLDSGDLGGNRLPYSPRASGSIGVDWTLGQVAGGDVVLAPTLIYSGRYYFDPNANPDVATSGFTRVNATLSWSRGPYRAQLWASNLFNEKYNTYGIDLSANTGNYTYSGAPPRTYGVSLARDF